MSTTDSKPAVIILEDGHTFYGKGVGKKGTSTGEICFNTGMTGYQEIFTDPSYYGQLMISTNVHVGNYGVLDADNQSSKVQIEGLICKSFTSKYSRPMADGDLQDYFESRDLVAITQVDTRALVRHIRDKGAMNAIISSDYISIEDLKIQLKKVPSMDGLELASIVSRPEAQEFGDEMSVKRIAALDFGIKQNIIDCFVERGCFVKVFPAKTAFSVLKEWNPTGYFLSNGPGDPSSMDYAIATIKNILEENVPVFGICLGHQLLALSVGIPTYKMHNGHRGINHPVKNLISGKCEITSQNHGFGVDPDAIRDNENIEITHINLNDDTIEGIRIKGTNAFSIQYHPEAAPGPHDARYLFDNFVSLI